MKLAIAVLVGSMTSASAQPLLKDPKAQEILRKQNECFNECGSAQKPDDGQHQKTYNVLETGAKCGLNEVKTFSRRHNAPAGYFFGNDMKIERFEGRNIGITQRGPSNMSITVSSTCGSREIAKYRVTGTLHFSGRLHPSCQAKCGIPG